MIAFTLSLKAITTTIFLILMLIHSITAHSEELPNGATSFNRTFIIENKINIDSSDSAKRQLSFSKPEISERIKDASVRFTYFRHLPVMGFLFSEAEYDIKIIDTTSNDNFTHRLFDETAAIAVFQDDFPEAAMPLGWAARVQNGFAPYGYFIDNGEVKPHVPGPRALSAIVCVNQAGKLLFEPVRKIDPENPKSSFASIGCERGVQTGPRIIHLYADDGLDCSKLSVSFTNSSRCGIPLNNLFRIPARQQNVLARFSTPNNGGFYALLYFEEPVTPWEVQALLMSKKPLMDGNDKDGANEFQESFSGFLAKRVGGAENKVEIEWAISTVSGSFAGLLESNGETSLRVYGSKKRSESAMGSFIAAYKK